MLENTVNDYAAYLKLNVSGELKSVQDVIDNMLTRLEELSSVMQMIRAKNGECAASVSDDIIKYRQEVIILSKKINTLCEVIAKIHSNVDALEKQVEKAELHFSVNNDNKLKSFLMPLLRRAQVSTSAEASIVTDNNYQLPSVMDYFKSS